MEIINFDESKVITYSEVKKYLHETFPLRHIASLQRIEYNDIYIKYDGYQPQSFPPIYIKNTLGTCEFIEDKTGYLIRIYRQYQEGCNNLERIKTTIAHEIGHIVYSELPSDLKILWAQIDKNIIRLKSGLSTEENFVEHYLAYINYYNHSTEFPNEYSFMLNKVFSGRKYRIRESLIQEHQKNQSP